MYGYDVNTAVGSNLYNHSNNMNFSKLYAFILLLNASCNSEENSNPKTENQSQAKNKNTIQEQVKPQNTTALELKKQLLGLWTDANSENAIFEVKPDSIYYTEQFKSYKYNLNKDTISIVYDDFTFEGQIQFQNDTLIMTADEYEPQKFWRYIN